MVKRTFSILALFVALTAGVAHAQSITVSSADIPFSFQIGNTSLPAGHYVFTVNLVEQHILIVSPQTKADIRILVDRMARPNKENAGKDQSGTLVFSRVGGTLSLSQVWGTGGEECYQLPQARSI